LGIVTDVTGPTLQYPEVAPGALAAADAVNAAGGVKDPEGGENRPIEIVECDEAGTPAQSSKCGRELVSEKVMAVVGSVALFGDSYGKVVTSAGIPIIGMQAASTVDLTDPLSYPMSGTTVALYLQSVGYLASLGVKSIAIEHVQATAANAAVSAVKERAGKLGIDVVNVVPVPADAVDLVPFTAQISRGGAEGAVFIDSPARNGKFITALDSSGVNLKDFKSIGPLTEREVKALGSTADGWLTPQFTFPLTSTDNPGIAEFRKDMDSVKDAPEPNNLTLQAYTAVKVLADSVFPAMSKLDSKTLVETLPTLGPISTPQYVPFDWKSPVELLPRVPIRAFSKSVLVCQVTDGALTPTTDDFDSYL
jgi:ABC-type branched-subunit amino acid transport system substrate-binding protein